MKFILAAAWLLLASAPAGSEGTPECALTIKASGFRSAKGQALAALFNSHDGFPSKGEKAYRRASAEIKDGAAVFVFSGVPYGDYAASVLHDENSNGRLDSNWLGIPKEGVGSSKDPATRLGPPSFKDSAFNINSEELEIKITIRYNRKN